MAAYAGARQRTAATMATTPIAVHVDGISPITVARARATTAVPCATAARGRSHLTHGSAVRRARIATIRAARTRTAAQSANSLGSCIGEVGQSTARPNVASDQVTIVTDPDRSCAAVAR